MALSFEEILAAKDIAYTEVDCPEWGGKVRLRSLNVAQREQFELKLVKAGGVFPGYKSELLAATMVDDDGKALCTLKQAKDLASKNGAVVERVVTEAAKLSGMAVGVDDPIEEAKNV